MIKILFTDDDKSELEQERYNYPHPRVQRKIESVYLKSMNVSPGEICRLCNISRPAFAKYLRAYQAEGIDGLKHWGYTGRENQLMAHCDSLEAHFKKHPPMTSTQAVEEIERITGIRRSPTQVREFMRHIGMRCRKMGFVPKGEESEDKQREQDEFVKKNSSQNWRRQAKESGWFFS